jgi:hypothetical protein
MSVVSDPFVNLCTKRGKRNDVVIRADELLEMLGTLSENFFPVIIDICFRQKMAKLFRSFIDWWELNLAVIATVEFWVVFRGMFYTFFNPMNCSALWTSKAVN